MYACVCVCVCVGVIETERETCTQTHKEATREAEAGESLEPGRQRLQGTEIVPLHSSLGHGARLPSL